MKYYSLCIIAVTVIVMALVGCQNASESITDLTIKQAAGQTVSALLVKFNPLSIIDLGPIYRYDPRSQLGINYLGVVMTDLGTLGGRYIVAYDINEQVQVVEAA